MEDELVGTGTEERRVSRRMRPGNMKVGWRCQMLVFICVLVKYNGSVRADWPG